MFRYNLCYEMMFAFIHGRWWLEDYPMRPNDEHIRRMYGIKEHQPRNWFEMDLQKAENVVRVYAWRGDDGKWQAYEIGYCERRLSVADVDEIAQRIRSYDDIPF